MATAAIAQSGRILPAPVTVTVASEKGQLGEIDNLSGDGVHDRPKSFAKIVRNDRSQMKLQNCYYRISPNTADTQHSPTKANDRPANYLHNLMGDPFKPLTLPLINAPLVKVSNKYVT